MPNWTFRGGEHCDCVRLISLSARLLPFIICLKYNTSSLHVFQEVSSIKATNSKQVHIQHVNLEQLYISLVAFNMLIKSEFLQFHPKVLTTFFFKDNQHIKLQTRRIKKLDSPPVNRRGKQPQIHIPVHINWSHLAQSSPVLLISQSHTQWSLPWGHMNLSSWILHTFQDSLYYMLFLLGNQAPKFKDLYFGKFQKFQLTLTVLMTLNIKPRVQISHA